MGAVPVMLAMTPMKMMAMMTLPLDANDANETIGCKSQWYQRHVG